MQECRKEKVLVIEGWVLTEEGEQKRTLQEKGPPRLSTNTHANIVAIPRACCLLAHYPGSKQQRLEADRTGGVIICGGKLHPGIMFVHWWSWQNGGLIHFKKWRNLFPWHHYVRYFVTLTHGEKKKKDSKLEGNELKLQLGSRPGGIEGIHMTGAHFHTITATVMAVIGWIGPLISYLQPLFTPQTSLGQFWDTSSSF